MFWFLIFLSVCIGYCISIVTCWYIPYIKKCLWEETLEEYLKENECQIDFEWKFTKADLILATKDSDDGYLRGKCFYAYNIPGLQCHLNIYPNGSKENQGQTCMYLLVNASKEREIAAEFTFSVESANFSENVDYVFGEYHFYGISICKTAEFFDRKKKYFMDEEITIKVKGTLKAQRSSVSKISSPISLKWKIKEDDLKKAMKPESNGRLKSIEFSIPLFNGVRYWFVMNTKKLNDKNQAQRYLYLFVAVGADTFRNGFLGTFF